MEIQQFRYFLAAARYENLTKAAEDLHTGIVCEEQKMVA